MRGSLSIESLRRPAVLIPLGLFLAAFILRLAGIGWGLPNDLRNQSLHPDETVNYGVSQAVDLGSGNLAPGFYNYGTAYFVAWSVADKIVKVYGGTGEPRTPDEYWASVAQGIRTGRVLNVLAGAGTVVVIWLILRRITTLFGALFGVAVVAAAPGFLVHSRFATVDVFAVFWLTLSALFALRIIGAQPGSLASEDARTPGDLRDALVAGVFAGVSTGTKYTGILVLLVLWVSLALARRPRWWVAALAGSGAALVAFFATTPGVLLDSARFWRDFQYELGHTAAGHGLVFAGTPSGFVYHLATLAVGVGLLLTLAGAAGLAYASFKKHRWAIALLVFALVYYVVIGRAEIKFMRYTFPLLLPIAVGYGYAMGAAHRRSGWARIAVAGGIFALAGIDFGGIVGAARYTQFMVGPDPRDAAARHLRAEGAGSTVGFVKDPWFWSVSLIRNAGLNRGQLDRIFAEVAASRDPKVLRYLPADGATRRDWDVRLLTESRPDYVVYTSFEEADERRLSNSPGIDSSLTPVVDEYRRFMDRLRADYALDAVFGPLSPAIHDLMYIQPTVWIWKRKEQR